MNQKAFLSFQGCIQGGIELQPLLTFLTSNVAEGLSLSFLQINFSVNDVYNSRRSIVKQ